MLKTAPIVLKRFQNRLYSNAGRLADAATAKASATRKAMFSRCAGIASKIATDPMAKAAIRTTIKLALLRRLSLLDHVGVEVMRDRGRRGQGQARNHREDRGEGDR